MFGKLLPKETAFFDFFDQHVQITRQAAQTFSACMQAELIPFQEDPNSIKILEHQADEITHHVIENLHKSFITPFQQEDIFQLISHMDDIIDAIDEAFEYCLIYKISSTTPAVRELARLLVIATEEIEEIVKGLRYRRKETTNIRKKCLHIHTLENQTDKVLRRALAQLFEEEQDLRLVIKWKEIYEGLEQAMDYCEDVANIIEGIILEYD